MDDNADTSFVPDGGLQGGAEICSGREARTTETEKGWGMEVAKGE